MKQPIHCPKPRIGVDYKWVMVGNEGLEPPT